MSTKKFVGEEGLVRLVANVIAKFAPKSHTHTKSQITDFPTAATTSADGLMTSAMVTKLNGIAEGANKYTLPSAGSNLGGVKSGGDCSISSGIITVNDDSHNHVIANIDGLQDALNSKASSSHNHNDLYYTEAEIDAKFDAVIGEGASETLDTIGEISAAIEDNQDMLDTLNAAIGSKQATITGGASTITSNNLTANRALVSNGNGKVAVSAVTSTELGYLDGVTSNVQSQLDSIKSNLNTKISKNTASLELNGSGELEDYGGFIDFHFGGSTDDYTSRIIEDAEGHLTVNASNNVTFTTSVIANSFTGSGASLTSLNAGNISSGTLPIARGGTGASDAASARANLGVTLSNLGVTATAAELNRLDGVTATTAELNILDGVTATAAEINKLDGLTASTAELNYVKGVTSAIQTQLNGKSNTDHTHDGRYYTETEVDSKLAAKQNSLGFTPIQQGGGENQLTNKVYIGWTGSTLDLQVDKTNLGTILTTGTAMSNVLPVARGGTGATTAAAARSNLGITLANLGVTATAAELNKLDGCTATVTELNYLDGVTSNIQTQLNNKAASSHTHTIANVTNLETTLNSKLDKSGGDITGKLNINNSSSNGLVLRRNSSDTESVSHSISDNQYTVSYTNDETSNNITFKMSATDTEQNGGASPSESSVTFSNNGNASTVTADTFSGKLNGNSATATKLAAAKTISLTGDVTGSTSFDGSGNVSITATVADDSHNHVISNVDGLQTALDGKAAYSHSHPVATTSANGFMTAAMVTKLNGIATGANAYTLPTASSSTLGGVKTTSTVTSTSGLTACPIISGVPYYKDTNTTYSLSSFGITATAAELNYCDGVTSNIQTQLNGKAASSHSHSNYLSTSGGTVNGDLTVTGILYGNGQQAYYYNSSTKGQVFGTANATGGTTIAAGDSSTVQINGALLKTSTVVPKTTGTYYCGNSNFRWKGIYSAAAVDVSSDERLKENIESIDADEAVNLIENIDVKSFNYIGDDRPQIGVIAQDILEISPELAQAIVTQGEDGYYGVKTSDLVFPLIATVQEMSKKIEELTKEIEELKKA